ncbi:hypothetical protein [Isoptericola sp. NPDC057191]|uniref:hypothetical protein n=1 Tax=Isoptericola sp. NPDC057191 TaxID=3346041 RepID=UPI003630A363
MPEPTPMPTLHVITESTAGFWENGALLALIGILVGTVLGGVISHASAQGLAGRKEQQDLDTENRMIRRELYVDVLRKFDDVHHAIGDWIAYDDKSTTGRSNKTAEKHEAGARVATSLNDMTLLASAVLINGNRDLAQFLREVTVKENLPKDANGKDPVDIADLDSEQWKSFGAWLREQRETAEGGMAYDIQYLSAKRAPFWARQVAFLSVIREHYQERRAERKATRAAK